MSHLRELSTLDAVKRKLTYAYNRLAPEAARSVEEPGSVLAL
jgi:hypothetical protein